MKKTLALILAVLVAFSMLTVATFAADGDLVSINFVDDDGKEIASYQVAIGENVVPYVPANPEKESTETTKYTFAGWVSSFDGETYFANTIPNAAFDVTYKAEYSEKDISGNQTLLQFFRSIFERINLIFEYFATIFNFT